MIAAGLILITLQLGTPRATAQFGEGCGSFTNPCYIDLKPGQTLPVTIY